MDLRTAWETYICTAAVPKTNDITHDLFAGLVESAKELWKQWYAEAMLQPKGTLADVLASMHYLPNSWDMPLEERDWCGWPYVMQKTGYYQCTGAALLALVLLEEWDISYRIANPVGHVVLMGKTNKKDMWWYLDGTPEHQQYHEFLVDEEYIHGTQVLVVQGDVPIPFQRIPVYAPTMLVGLLLDNLALLSHAYDQQLLPEVASFFMKPLHKFPWGEWYHQYFSERIHVNEHPLLQEELRRLQRKFPNRPQGTHVRL